MYLCFCFWFKRKAFVIAIVGLCLLNLFFYIMPLLEVLVSADLIISTVNIDIPVSHTFREHQCKSTVAEFKVEVIYSTLLKKKY